MKNLFFVLSLFSFHFLFAENIVNGVILDNNDLTPLIGVNIFVEGMEDIATISGDDGSFSLDIPDESSTIVFSYLGYSSKEVSAAECKDAIIYLSVSANLLNEVIIVGYGTQFRSDVTGSIAKVGKGVIDEKPIHSFESILQGLVPGVFVSNNSGKLGQNINVRIRGTASINASIEPLYVVDGVVMSSQDQLNYYNSRSNPLADFNFNDIESIEILKDAAASSIYGSKASNGVIIITTKQGMANTTKIDLDVSTGWSRPTRKRKWLNADQYLELWDEAFINVANQEGKLFGQTAERWKDRRLSGWRDGYDTDWESLMYNPDAGLKQVQLNISGGTDKTTFYVSAGFSNQIPIVFLNSFRRLTGRINLTHHISSKLDVGINMSLATTDQETTPPDPNFASPAGLVSQSPVQPVYDPNNQDELFTNTVYFHALFYKKNSERVIRNFRSLGKAYINYSILKDLTLHTDFGFDILDSKGGFYYNSKIARNTGEENGIKHVNTNEAINYTLNHYAHYKHSIQAHNIDATAGMTFQKLTENRIVVSGRNFPNDDFQNISSAGEIIDADEAESAFSVLSWFSRFNYNFDHKYLFSFSSRIDGDSRFGKKNRFGYFPALSLGWVVSKETFFTSDNLSYLKIRGSWGLTGNTPIERFPGLGLFAGRGYAGGSGIVQTQIENPNLKWEKTKQLDIGIDFGFLNDRISGQIDYYYKKTTDLLLRVNVPATTGFSTQIQNIGAMQNKGIELLLDAYVTTGAFKWQTSFNFSKNKNLVTDLKDQVIETSSIDNSFISIVKEGQPIGVFFAPEFAGVDPANGDALYYLNDELPNGQLNKGTTNSLNEAKRVVIGDPNPDFIYGFGNTFSWNGMELNVFFQGVHGNDIFDGAGRFQQDGFGWFDNQDIRMLNRWQKPGDITEIPQLRFLQGTFHSSRFIDDGSYLRLKNLSLSYLLPKTWIKKIGFHQVKFYVTGQNLLTFTNYKGRDPEVNTDYGELFTNGRIVRGMDFFTPPQAKTIIIGLRIGF